MDDFQKKLVDMLRWLVEFLEKNNLRYYVVEGTMLGAVRHEGLIPWDDDIDIGMPRADYEKLIELLSNPIDHYVVESYESPAKDYVYAFAKFYDINTSMTEKLYKNVKRGVYIDIFPLDGLANTKEEALKHYKKIDMRNMLLATKVCALRKGRKFLKNCAIIVGRCIPVNIKKLIKKINRLCKEHDFDSCDYVVNSMSTYRSREIMEKRIYGEPTRYKFEDFYVYGPEKADEYLTLLYKNWRQFPPEDKRHAEHDFIDLDLNKPYNGNYMGEK